MALENNIKHENDLRMSSNLSLVSINTTLVLLSKIHDQNKNKIHTRA